VSRDAPKPRHEESSIPQAVRQELEHLLYHAEQSELTTGRSHIDFLYSVLVSSLDRDFVFLMVSCGLSLCLQEWIARRPAGELDRIFDIEVHFQSMNFPLISSLVFAPPWGVFHDRYMTTIRLLLENGYSLQREWRLLPWLIKETWYGKLPGSPTLISDASLFKLISWALQFGASPSEKFELSYGTNLMSHIRCIHIAPPPVAAELLRYGVDPNEVDDDNRTALDWVLRLPNGITRKPSDWDLKRKYDMCNVLLRAGGTFNNRDSRVANTLLDELKKAGYDVEFIVERVSVISNANQSRGFGAVRTRIEGFGSGSGSDAEGPGHGLHDMIEDKDSRWQAGKAKLKRVLRFGKEKKG